MAPPSTADPNTEPDGHPGTLADAAARLEAALARLEALVDAGPLQSELFRGRDGDDSLMASTGDERVRAELDAAHGRSRTLEAAAAAASEALGRAMVQVRDVLGDDGDGDGGDHQEPALDLMAARADDAPP